MRYIENLEQLGVPLLIAKREHINHVMLGAEISTEAVYIPGLEVRGGAETFTHALRVCKVTIDAATTYIVENEGKGMPGDLKRLPLAKTVRKSLDSGHGLFLRFAYRSDCDNSPHLNWRTRTSLPIDADWKI